MIFSDVEVINGHFVWRVAVFVHGEFTCSAFILIKCKFTVSYVLFHLFLFYIEYFGLFYAAFFMLVWTSDQLQFCRICDDVCELAFNTRKNSSATISWRVVIKCFQALWVVQLWISQYSTSKNILKPILWGLQVSGEICVQVCRAPPLNSRLTDGPAL